MAAISSGCRRPPSDPVRSLRLLILGASGGCGRWLTRLAARRGHEVTAPVRPGSTFTADPGVVMLEGDVTDAALLDRLLAGQQAVLSALGLRRAGRSPWAPLRSPPDLATRVAQALVPAMRRQGVGRLIAISAGGVGDSAWQLTWPVRKLVSAGNVAVAYRDLESMEAVLETSGLDWLAVRPVTLIDGDPTERARPVERYRLMSAVRRADVAQWMLDAVEEPAPFAERRVLLGR